MKTVNLTDKEVEEIREALQTPYHGQQLDLAAKYGVTRWVIANIKHNRTRLRKISKGRSVEAVRRLYLLGYRVSNSGVVTNPDGKVLTSNASGGYGNISRIVDGERFCTTMHRFAAYCFYGEKLFDAECVRHLDGNKTNLSRENIVLGTISDNANDRKDLSEFSSKHRFTRLSREQVQEILALSRQGKTGYEIGKEMGVDKATAYRIINGKSYREYF